MILKLVLPWFPILLAVGLGGRLLGRSRGFALGALAALFWLALVQAMEGAAVWNHWGSAMTLVAGAAAIMVIGGWAGEAGAFVPGGRVAREDAASTSNAAFSRFSAVMDQFDQWLEAHRDDANPWPKFDEFVRTALQNLCGASHVLPLRYLPESAQLVSLREPGGYGEVVPVSASRGIPNEVLSTGRAFVAESGTPGTIEGISGSVAWCFPVLHGSRRLGVVVARYLSIAPDENREQLSAAKKLTAHFWGMVEEVCFSRQAVQDDPVSGLYTREAFLRVAGEALRNSYRQGEPVAMVVLALERMRELNDRGQWELADELLRGVGHAMRQKIRGDDRAARFDGSRFVILLRRVDGELARLIVAQLMARLRGICGDERRWGATIGVRCGFACSGEERPDLRTLISRALAQWRQAREADSSIVGDARESEPSEAVRS